MPVGVGRGQTVGLDFCHILTLLPPGASVFHKHMSSSLKSFVCRNYLLCIKCTYYMHFVFLHEWKFSPSPIGLKCGWAKRHNPIATSDDVIRGRYNARLVSRQVLLVADNIDVSL